MQKLINGKKLFSAILSLSIILGAVLSVPNFSARAEGETFTKVKLTDNDVAEIAVDNLLSTSGVTMGMFPDWNNRTTYGCYISYGGGLTGTTGNATAIARLTDGDTVDPNFGNGTSPNTAGHGAAFQLNKVSGTNISVTDMYIRISFTLPESKAFSDILLGWSELGSVKTYNIYASADDSTLYNPESKIVAVEGETEEKANRLISLRKSVTAKYICFEFTNANNEFTNKLWVYSQGKKNTNGVALTELGVYEKVSDDVKAEYKKRKMSDSEVAAWNNSNLLAPLYDKGLTTNDSGKYTISTYYQITTKWNTSTKTNDSTDYFTRGTFDNPSYWLNEIKRLTDGLVDPSWAYDANAGDTYTVPSGSAVRVSTKNSPKSENAMRFAFYFGSEKTISSFLIGWNEAFPIKGYNIYVGSPSWNSPTYDGGNPVVSVHNETEATCNRLITLDEPVKGKQVIFEFTYDDFTSADEANTVRRILLTELGAFTNTPMEAELLKVGNEYDPDSFAIGDDAWTDATEQKYTFIDTSSTDFNALYVKSNKPYTIALFDSTATDMSATPMAQFVGQVNDSEAASKLLYAAKSINTAYPGAKVAVVTDKDAEITVKYANNFTIKAGDLNGSGAFDQADFNILQRELLFDSDAYAIVFTDVKEDKSFDICDLVALKKNLLQ